MTRSANRHLFNRLEGVHASLLSDLAAEQIMRLIRSGQLTPGSRLPAERELAQQLGVSRTALREALRILEATRVLEASVGRGRFVTANAGRKSSALPGWQELQREEVAELNHVLQLVEPAGILEVPVHLVPEVVADARAICARAQEAIGAADVDAAAALDVEFHLSLCRRTPNRLLRDLLAKLIQSMADSAHAVYGNPVAAQHSLDQHLKIVDALEAGSRERASSLLRDHAATAYRFAAEQIAAEKDQL
jgi:DNA-binding FadR family transcriptional regulator